jgi:hypothetical protein
MATTAWDQLSALAAGNSCDTTKADAVPAVGRLFIVSNTAVAPNNEAFQKHVTLP